jgi:hypothetical protein
LILRVGDSFARRGKTGGGRSGAGCRGGAVGARLLNIIEYPEC